MKEPAKNFGASEATIHGDGLKSVLTILKSAPRGVEARAFYERAGGYAHLPLEITREAPCAHVHAFRECFQRKISFEVLEDPMLQVGDRTRLQFLSADRYDDGRCKLGSAT